MSKAQQTRFINNADDSQKQIVRILKGLSHQSGIDRIWSDWVEMSAIALANAVDKAQFETREKRYLDIVAKYKKDDVQRLVEAFSYLVQCWDIRVQAGEYGDVLGSIYMMMDMGNSHSGQFFTPYEVSHLMGQILGVGQELQAGANARGFARLMEPTCGAGGMIIAAAHSMREAGLNYQQQLHVTAIDIDLRCVHMTYLQLSLLHIPAIVIHGNALSVEEWSHWYTPAHIMGGWPARLRRQEAIESMQGLILGAQVDPEANAAEIDNNSCHQERAGQSTTLTGSSRKAAKAAAAAGQMQLF